MSAVASDIQDLDDICLKEKTDDNAQYDGRDSKRPKQVLCFSDGVLEEYSEDEADLAKETKTMTQVDPKTLQWLPWAWYQTTSVTTKLLDGCDYVGECLASFFGITSPKYQFEINEFYRLQAVQHEIDRRNDLEMGGWNDQYKNNLMNNNILLREHN